MKSHLISLLALSMTMLVSSCGMSPAQWRMARECQQNPGSGLCRQAQEDVREDRESARQQRALQEEQREYERRRKWEQDYNASEKAAEERRAREEARIARQEESDAAIAKWRSTVERLKSSDHSAADEEFPQLTWMTGFWCERNPPSDYRALPDGLPHVYFEVQESGALRKLHLWGEHQVGQHIEPIRAKYFDVYSYLRKADSVWMSIKRFQKRSDDQFFTFDIWSRHSNRKFPDDAAIIDDMKRVSARRTVRWDDRTKKTYDRCG